MISKDSIYNSVINLIFYNIEKNILYLFEVLSKPSFQETVTNIIQFKFAAPKQNYEIKNKIILFKISYRMNCCIDIIKFSKIKYWMH